MKRVFLAVLFFVLASGMSRHVAAQQGQQDRGWKRFFRSVIPIADFPFIRQATGRNYVVGASGVQLANDKVSVFNATDGKPVVVFKDGRRVAILEPGEVWGLYLIPSIFGYGGNIVINAKVCVSGEVRTFYFPSPEWATDETTFGPSALTEEFLQANPPEKVLEHRVDAIKRILDGREILGRKERKKELAQWFQVVKKRGVYFKDIDCVGPILPGRSVFFSNYNYYRQSYVFRVVGNEKYGYRIVDGYGGY